MRETSIPTETTSEALALPDHQHFSHVVARKEEFDRSEIAEEGFDVAVIEDSLQAEAVNNGGVNGSSGPPARFAAHDDALHLQRVFADDVEAVAGRIRPGILCMEES